MFDEKRITEVYENETEIESRRYFIVFFRGRQHGYKTLIGETFPCSDDLDFGEDNILSNIIELSSEDYENWVKDKK